MTPAQWQTFATHIGANTDPTIIVARTPATRNDSVVRDWYNTASTTDAWRYNMRGLDLWKAMTLTQYDGITIASKRELWMKWIDIANIEAQDFGRQENRNAVTDIWTSLNNAQMTNLLGKLIEKALRVELVFNPLIESTSSPVVVSAVDRVAAGFVGQCSSEDVGRALNILNAV